MTARATGSIGCGSAAPAPASTGGCATSATGQTTRYGRVDDAVGWYEGMLLAPQHFQQAQLQAEQLLGYHLAALSPYHWGVRRLVLDCAALQRGTLIVQELEAVMPDGLVARHDAAADGGALSVALQRPADAARQDVLTVHLAVRSRAANPIASGDLARCRPYTAVAVADQLTGAGAVEIARLRPRLSLQLSAQRPRGWVSLPLARVRRTETGWALADALPPLLSLPPELPLGARCARLACAVRARAVEQGRALRRARAAGERARAAAAQSGLAALSAALPRLEALVHSGAAHPFSIHLALLDLAGHLAAAGPGCPVPLFRPYDHDDPHGSLVPVLRFCERAAEEVQNGFALVPFRRRRGGFNLPPRRGWTGLDELIVGAVAPDGATPAQLGEWVARARIASVSRMAGLRAGGGVGAPREVVAAPAGLPESGGRVYFRVAMDHGFILPGERLQVRPPVACAGDAAPRRLALCLSLAAPADSTPAVSP